MPESPTVGPRPMHLSLSDCPPVRPRLTSDHDSPNPQCRRVRLSFNDSRGQLLSTNPPRVIQLPPPLGLTDCVLLMTCKRHAPKIKQRYPPNQTNRTPLAILDLPAGKS